MFTVGIDTAVNDGFLRRLSALGGGTSTFVEPGALLEEALQAVGREIGTPLVTGLRVEGEATDLAPSRMPDLFTGRASTVFFRFGGRRAKVTGQFADGGRFEQEVEAREAPPASEHRERRRTPVTGRREAREALDHHFLNEVEGLEVPTLERIAIWLWDRLHNRLFGLTEIQISRDSCHEGCIYAGPRRL